MLRILVADDHAVVRAGLKTLLESHEGFHVVAEASDGEQAIRFAKEFHPDVAVLDIRMPGLSGIETCKRIVEQVPNCRVVILTSYAEDELLVSAIEAGASGYVLKRIGNDELLRAVERVGNGEAILDPAMTSTVFSKVKEANRAQVAESFSGLTSQELAVLSLIAEGKTNRQIAGALYLGEGTVRNYVSSVLSKIGVSNRAEAAIYAVKNKISEIAPSIDDN